MYKDYSGSLILANGRNRIRPARRKPAFSAGELLPTSRLMWKTVGAMLLATLVVGISSTVWYGMQVQAALDQIGRNRAVNSTLSDENRLLLAQRDLLLTREHMEEAARKFGLHTPAKDQLRYR